MRIRIRWNKIARIRNFFACWSKPEPWSKVTFHLFFFQGRIRIRSISTRIHTSAVSTWLYKANIVDLKFILLKGMLLYRLYINLHFRVTLHLTIYKKIHRNFPFLLFKVKVKIISLYLNLFIRARKLAFQQRKYVEGYKYILYIYIYIYI